jgi:hypothetical protein
LRACAACMARLAPFGACCIKRQIKFTWNGEVHAPRLETLAGLSKSVIRFYSRSRSGYYFHYEVDGPLCWTRLLPPTSKNPDFITPRTYEATHKGFFCRRHLQQYAHRIIANDRITVRCCALLFLPVITRLPASSFRFRRPHKLLIGSHAFFPRFPSFLEAFLHGPLIICSPETSQPLQAFHANPPRIIRTTNCIPR